MLLFGLTSKGGGLCKEGTCWVVTVQRTEQGAQRDTVPSLQATVPSSQDSVVEQIHTRMGHVSGVVEALETELTPT